MSEAQEASASTLLRSIAEERHGEEVANLTDAQRKALTRDVAALMRRRSRSVEARQRITVEGVRMLAQRKRSTPETRTGFPVDLDAEAYALIAQLHADKGGTMKALASSAIREVYGDQAGGR